MSSLEVSRYVQRCLNVSRDGGFKVKLFLMVAKGQT